MNLHDILKTALADVIKGQTDMSYKGELQTLTEHYENGCQIWYIPAYRLNVV